MQAERRLFCNVEAEMTNAKSGTDPLPEELARVLFNKLAKTYVLITEEWRARRRPLLEALIAYEYDETIAAKMRGKLEDVLENASK